MILSSLFIGNFISYYLITLIDVFTLSVFGLFTCFLAKIKMNYKALFNMSIYALTLSIILKIIYIGLDMLLGFEIKYFSIMYIAVSYITLAAAIFLIKSDVKNKEKIEQTIKIPKKPEKDDDEDKSDENEKENKDTHDDKDAGRQGSNA